MKHHILAIGVSRHNNPFVKNLSYAAKDAIEFFNLFTSNIGSIGYQKLIIDSEATLSQIRTALGSELQNAIEPEDAFFFFYSGHGTISEDADNSSFSHYLLPFDATLDITNSSISVSYLKEIFSKLPSKANFIFIDSCFSGSMSLTKGYTSPNKKAFKQVKTFTNTVIGTGTLIFTASKDDEEAIEDPEYENGLFTHFLLQELQRERTNDKFPVLDTFTPITEEVIKRAKDKYHHNQTPTLNGYVEGGVYLPKFRNKIKISPQMLEVPKYPELSSVSFPIPELQFKEKEQEKIINEMISFVVSGRQTQQIATQEIIFERFCSRLIKKLNEDWERIFIEDGSNVSEIPNSVAKLEAASFQFILLGGVVAVFGSERQMEIYSQYGVKMLEMTKNKAGLVALIAIPEIILAEIIYTIGALCIARDDMKPLNILLKTKTWNFEEGDYPPRLLIHHREIYYCDAFGGDSTKVNDHIMKVLKSFSWLTELAPKIEGPITNLQLQVNFLLVMLTYGYGNRLWPDFGRYYAIRIIPLIQKIKYDVNFRKQIADIFEVKEEEIRNLLMKCLIEAQQIGLGGYHWSSIRASDLLTEEEKRNQQESGTKK